MSFASFERLEERRFLSVGDLDSTFGTGGEVTTDFSGGTDQGRQIVVSEDGKILVIGNTNGPSGTGFQNFGLARYNDDGSLDTTFGNGGKVITDFNNGRDSGLAVQIQDDGKIVAAGVGGSAGTFVIARYNVDGTLDGSFGTGGKVITGFDSNPNIGLGLQGNKIILGGTTALNFEVARYNSDGFLDGTFGSATTPGRVVTDLGGADVMFSLVVQPDGRIVTAGFSSVSSGIKVAFARYTGDGGLDSTFNGNGILLTTFGTIRNAALALALQGDGKIVAAGVSYTAGGSDENTALLRLNPDGTFDNSFDGDGRVITDFGGGDNAMSVVIQNDGKIIAGGNNLGHGWAIARYNLNGSLDGSFGNGGKVTTLFTGGGAEFGMTLQPDGKLLAVGQVGAFNQNFGIARYITSEPAESAPVAAAASISLNEDQSISAAVSATDADNDSLSFSLLASPEHGSIQFNADGTYSYTPHSNFNGHDSFTFGVSDGTLSDSASVSITVLPVNDAPTADGAAAIVSEDGMVDISLTGSDVETSTDQLVFTILNLPQNGVLSYQGAAVHAGDTFTGSPTDLTYAPGAANDNSAGDSFTFAVTDTGDSNSASLTSNIANVAISIDRAAPGTATLGEDGILRIGGSDGNDNISVTANGAYLKVVMNGKTLSDGAILLCDVSEVRVWSRAGDDQIDLSGLSIDAFIHGGDGNDLLVGGAGDDLILGGNGTDQLTGAAGNDFLIGGDGSDRIVGSSGHDVLTAGDISSQFTLAALRAISAAWAADKTLSEDDQSMADDGVVDENNDQLTGASGADWFIISSGDKITDLAQMSSHDGDLITYVD